MTERSRILAFRVACGVLLAGALADVVLALVAPARVAALMDAISRIGLGDSGARLAGSAASTWAIVTGSLEVLVAAALLAALAWRAAERREVRVLALYVATWLVPISLLSTLGVPARALAALAGALEPLRWTFFLRFAAMVPAPLSAGRLAANAAGRRTPLLLRPFSAVAHVLAAPLRWVLRPIAQRGIPRAQRPEFRLRRALAAALLRPAVVWSAGILAALLAIVFTLRANPMGTFLAVLWGYAALAQGVLFLLVSYRAAAGPARRSLLWLLQGFYAAAWVFGLNLLFGAVVGALAAVHAGPGGAPVVAAWTLAVSSTASLLAIVLILVGLAVGIFYRGALDPALAVRKTTVYGALTITAGFLFTVLEETAANFLQSSLHMSSNLVAGVAGAIVAVSIGPLRGWISRAVERRVPALAGGAVPAAPAEATLPAGAASPSA